MLLFLRAISRKNDVGSESADICCVFASNSAEKQKLARNGRMALCECRHREQSRSRGYLAPLACIDRCVGGVAGGGWLCAPGTRPYLSAANLIDVASAVQ